MSADIGAAGSSHASHSPSPALPGPEEATVIRRPVASTASDHQPETRIALTGRPDVQLSATPSPTLKRLFDTEQSVFGLRLDDFLLEERIGTGGMGAVFKAHDARLSRKVALKVLSPKACSDTQLVDRFHNEARAAARLSHDNIARVHSSGEDLGVHYIAYELIAGTNLRNLIAQQSIIRIPDALSYSIQIAMALNHTFAEGVVHRDIKPSNIIITPDGRARVVDLGLARRDGEDSIADLTVAGSTLGTFDYISPEQAQDPRQVDIRSDIYSLGCTMFHMLTGQPPYPEGTALQKLLDHKGKDAPSPIQVNRKVPRDLSAVVHRMMSSDPAERHSTPAELVDHLIGIANHLGLRGIQPEGLVWMRSHETKPPFLQRHLGWILASGLLLLGVIALRLQPHTVDTDSSWSQLRATQPSDSNGTAVTSQGESNPEPNNEAAEAIVAFGGSVAELLWPERPWEIPGADEPSALTDQSPVLESGRAIASTIGGMFTELATEMRDSIRRSKAAGSTSSPSGTEEGSASGSTPLITLRSDPEKPYTTLEAACWDAEDGDVVEIRPDRNNTPLVEKPIRIVKKRLTIRGVEVRGRVPLIRFDVGADDTQSQMMTLVAGELSVANVEIQLITRDDVAAESWTLCAFDGSDRVEFENVTIDVPNKKDQPATVFEVTLGDEAAARMEDEADDYRIRLTNCFVRGNCDLFRVETPLPGFLELKGSAISITGSLLDVLGTNEALQERDRLDLELTHTTCLLGQGILRMNNIDILGGPTRALLPIEVVTESSIFATTADEPFIRMEGASDSNEFRALLTWKGQQNLYQGFDVFWEVDSRIVGLEVYRDSFEDWKSNWADLADAREIRPVNGVSPWLSDRWEQEPLTQVKLVDLQLDETSPLATDGSNLGASLTNLRRFAPADRR